MRIWDIHPGYLNRQSLLGEHRELHGLISIIVNGKKGYSQHPETKRWVGYGWALKQRHKQLACEMMLRGYIDRSPVNIRSNYGEWPSHFIDLPHVQFALLKDKYKNKELGRIPLPKNLQQLWSHHKYSVLARSQKEYKAIGYKVTNRLISFEALSMELIKILRVRPDEKNLRNSLLHMWGYVSKNGKEKSVEDFNAVSLKKLLSLVQRNTLDAEQPYLMRSTSLSELMTWL